MKIINIDAEREYTCKIDELITFVLDVAEKNRKKTNEYLCLHLHQSECCKYVDNVPQSYPINPIRMFENSGYVNVFDLLHTIPIYLRKTNQYVHLVKNKYVDVDVDNGRPPHTIDLLGMYFSNNGNPYIELYMEQINKNVEGDDNKDEHFKWMFAMTLYHELAHAALDNHNLVSFKGRENLLYANSEFIQWREESMANAVALRIIKEYDRDENFYNYVRTFIMEHQGDEYALGVCLVEFDYWDFNSVMENKIKGVSPKLQDEWLSYVKGTSNPSLDELQQWNVKLMSENP